VRLKKLPLLILLALVGLALAVGAAEGLARVLDPFGAVTEATNAALYRTLIRYDPDSPRLFRLRPGQTLAMRGHGFRTDSRGLRGPERATPKPEGTKRLLFLGDSVVLGWGVAEEDTFVHLVERELSQRTGERWETVNAGHLLHDTTQELGVLEEVGLAYEPDLVLLVYVENDIVSGRAIAEASQRVGPAPTPEAQKAIARSQALRRIQPYLPALHTVLDFMLVRSLPVAQQGSSEQAHELGFSLEAGWEASRTALAGMHALLGARGVGFAVLDYQRDNRLSEELARFCAAEGIPHGCIAFTAEERREDLAVSRADAHANPRGHRILTAHILDEIVRLDLIPALH
jgi:hypothetical protein